MENKIIHEFYYIVGDVEFVSHYTLVVDRETNKMLYGTVIADDGSSCSRFAVKKCNLGQIQTGVNRKRGLVWHLQIAESEYEQAYKQAKEAIYRLLCLLADNFLLNCGLCNIAGGMIGYAAAQDS